MKQKDMNPGPGLVGRREDKGGFGQFKSVGSESNPNASCVDDTFNKDRNRGLKRKLPA